MFARPDEISLRHPDSPYGDSMGLEFFYRVFDRAAVDPVLAMRWTEYLAQRATDRESIEELLEFAVDGPDGDAPDPEYVQQILAERTLRWTMSHATPQFYFLHELVNCTPGLAKRCPAIWPEAFAEEAIFLGVSTCAFLAGKCTAPDWAAMMTLHGWPNLEEFLELTPAESKSLKRSVRSLIEMPKPMFPWQSGDFLDDGYACLGVRESRRLLRHIARAWAENWPVAKLQPDLHEILGLAEGASARIRQFKIARQFTGWGKPGRFERPCLLRYCG